MLIKEFQKSFYLLYYYDGTIRIHLNNKKSFMFSPDYSNGTFENGELKNKYYPYRFVKGRNKEFLGIFNKNYYFGRFNNKIRTGFGVEFLKNGICTLGNYTNNLHDGKFLVYYVNGNSYFGELKKGARDGLGVMFLSAYMGYQIGNWKNCNKNGIIKYHHPGMSDLIGYFKDDRPNGICIYKYLKDETVYSGYLNSNFKRYGYGLLKFKNGDMYEGYFDEDEYINGVGRIYYDNGNLYEGEIKKYTRDGYGILYHKDGTVEMGRFENNFLKEKI